MDPFRGESRGRKVTQMGRLEGRAQSKAICEAKTPVSCPENGSALHMRFMIQADPGIQESLKEPT